MSEQKIMTRGYRNNNPLNLRISAAQWQGKVPKEQRTDPAFEQFTCPGKPYIAGDPQQRVWGYRAAMRNLRTYFRTMNVRTLDGIINRWAPASDHNNTFSYLEHVCKMTGYSPLQVLPWEEETICRIVSAMAQIESAIPFGKDEALIGEAWTLL